MKVRSPVRNLASMRTDLAEWGTIEVECLKTPSRIIGGTHRGEWVVYCWRMEGNSPERSVMVAARSLEPRIFKTVSGLISLAIELGFTNPQIPLHEGELGIWDFEKQIQPSKLRGGDTGSIE